MTNLVKIAKTEISNSNKLCVIAGLNVLEDDRLTFEVAEKLKKLPKLKGILLYLKLLLIKPIAHL